MQPINRRDILRQLTADLIGKDSYRGVTLTYSWLANQCGHFSLGFIPAGFLHYFKYPSGTTLMPAVIISIGWLLFELYNFLGPLLSQRKSASKLLFAPGKKRYIFSPDWVNVAFDTATDVIFFCLGAFVSCFLFPHPWYLWLIIAGLTAVVSYPCYYWYLTKMFLQIPQFPFQFRLSQWDVSNENNIQQKVKTFIKNAKAKKGVHLFVYGAKGCGKTSLGVALATEMAIGHHTAVYTTGVKLFHMFSDAVEVEREAGSWHWRDASFIVIDDINPGGEIPDIISPQLFLQYVDVAAGATGNLNRQALKNANVVWVMGDRQYTKKLHDEWTAMLVSIDIDSEKIISVELPSVNC